MADVAEIAVDVARALVAEHFPAWAGRPLRPVPSAGTDHTLFRLGDDLVLRLPKVDWAVGGVEHEHRWLPAIAAAVPVPVPESVALGGPAAGYPWSWAVHRWLEGSNPAVGAPVGTALGEFVAALRGVGVEGAPPTRRGIPLAMRDEVTRTALAALGSRVDPRVVDVWERALAVPAWSGEPVWLHGDLSPGNVLVRGGRLAAVIDFTLSGVGDPAADLVVAWNLLTGAERDRFRAVLGDDDATWERGRGLALSIALVQLQHYEANPVLFENSRHVVAEILASSA
ncbi:aminoglycoside phosphotransferase family protein [Saccharothrix obliqua]|uniref:aminoglycoside phosphotransferase family protein n=1 Tax=Saccharothrix obliqua TaxID=2861747 RepID=UPI001C5E3BEC|nr:aminoglycoside phosphotransferase family protein [Saccharothrix obliqua]MBW4720112.1 aminoglycoside phosphotransferase family protein [Saccharothrix obliqua]